MSVICAVRKNGRVYMATNPTRKNFDMITLINNEESYRIHKVGDGILVGAIGPLVLAENLYLHESFFKTKNGQELDREFLTTTVMTKYIQLLNDKELLEFDDDGFPVMQCEFIVASGERIFHIDTDFFVTEYEVPIAIGDKSEGRFCEIYLNEKTDANPDLEPEELIKEAFVECTKVMLGAGEDVAIIDTESMKFRRI